MFCRIDQEIKEFQLSKIYRIILIPLRERTNHVIYGNSLKGLHQGELRIKIKLKENNRTTIIYSRNVCHLRDLRRVASQKMILCRSRSKKNAKALKLRKSKKNQLVCKENNLRLCLQSLLKMKRLKKDKILIMIIGSIKIQCQAES